jgi:hypothetical protein
MCDPRLEFCGEHTFLRSLIRLFASLIRVILSASSSSLSFSYSHREKGDNVTEMHNSTR